MSAPVPPGRFIDYRPLVDPVPQARLREFKRTSAASRGSSNTAGIVISVVIVCVVALVVLPVFFAIVASAFAAVGPLGAVVVFIIGAGILALIVWGVIASAGKTLLRTFRLTHFAAANGLAYRNNFSDPRYAGLIFGTGDSRQMTDTVHSVSGRFIDVGNYTYTTGSGKSRRTHSWGVMVVGLDRRLPHIVLDALSNNASLFGLSASNLPASFDKDQRLSLEGDFDKYFTLYCPAQYERDALYILTPDLMALLIDAVATFDVEIVDDLMFFYSRKPFAMTEPALWHRLFRIIDTVGAKAIRQTDYYADDRVGNRQLNVVAPPGQRLKRHVPWWAYVIIGVALLGILLGVVGFIGSIVSAFLP